MVNDPSSAAEARLALSTNARMPSRASSVSWHMFLCGGHLTDTPPDNVNRESIVSAAMDTVRVMSRAKSLADEEHQSQSCGAAPL
jgi:hypothetical protein